jgi:hypothetical protein
MKLAALLILTATPALAGPMTTATCQDVWAMVETVIGQPVLASAPSLTGTGCVVRDIEIPSEGDYGVAIKARSVRFAGDGLTATGDWLALTSLNLSVEDLRHVTQAPDPALSWLFEQQTARGGINIELNAAAVAGGWDVKALQGDFPGDNQLDLSAKVSGLDLTSRTQAIAALGTGRLNRLDLTLSMDGFFETYLLMPLGSALLIGSDNPQQRVNDLKAEAAALIDLLPGERVDAASKSALKDLIADLPHPKGKLTVRLDSDAGFGAPNLMQLAINGIGDDPAKTMATLLNGVDLTVSWTRAP